MNFICQDYESVWLDIWSKNVGHCDLYFMVHWFCLTSQKLFAAWTSYFRIMSQYDSTFDLKINVGHCDLYFMVQWFCLISWKSVWCMNIILQDYESVWPHIWHQNKCRSLWPKFYGPVILPHILKPIRYMNTILLDYGSVWSDVRHKTIEGDCDLYFMARWFYLISWRLFDVWTSYIRIMSQYDQTFDLKINVGHCHLYFMVQWFCLTSRRLFAAWTSYFKIMSQYDMTFDLKINVGHCDLYFMVQWFCLISWRLFDVWTSYLGLWVSLTWHLISK